MFIDNKYHKIYYKLIKKRRLNPLYKTIEYCESHHIIPTSLGGDDSIDNIINLTAREHYVAHKLLTKMTIGKAKRSMWWAFHRILYSNNSDFKTNSKNYEQFRKLWAIFLRDNHPSKTNDSWCEIVSNSIKKSWENAEERKSKFGITMKHNISEWRKTSEFSTVQQQLALKSKMKNCTKIEYYGKIYIGWSEFKRETGLDKRQHTYYTYGIDINFRKNKNGPITIDEIDELIRLFCKNNNNVFPSSKEEFIDVLNKMKMFGLVDQSQVNKFIKMKA